MRYNEITALCFQDLMDAILTLLQVFSTLLTLHSCPDQCFSGNLVWQGFDSIGGVYRPLVKQNIFCLATRPQGCKDPIQNSVHRFAPVALELYFVLAMLILSIALMNLAPALVPLEGPLCHGPASNLTSRRGFVQVTAVMVNSSLDQAPLVVQDTMRRTNLSHRQNPVVRGSGTFPNRSFGP